MLDDQTLPYLKTGKNLLAFSAGVDSTALFYLLREAGIAFDIAHVNYRTREQSDAEEAHARKLATDYGLQCHCLHAPEITSNFEAEARAVRYRYFEQLIAQGGYDNLLTAHQLDDRFEWLLMQFAKGAGLPELLGMAAIERRKRYILIRPLLLHSKSELREWLNVKGHQFFEDASNTDVHYMRNKIRHTFSSPFIKTYGNGVLQTFAFLERDAKLLETMQIPAAIDSTILLLRTSSHRLVMMRQIDQWLKHRGYLLRQGEKKRILQENELVIGRQYALSISSSCTLLTPANNSSMPKSFKEKCRKLGIGKMVRPYLYVNSAVFQKVCSQLTDWQSEV